MSDLNEINRTLGNLEAQVQNLTTAVTTLTGVVEGFKKTTWTMRGVFAGLTLTGGAIGSKLTALLGGLPPQQHP